MARPARMESKMAEAKKQGYDPWEDKVPVTLFYDGANYKEDVYVAVNGRRFQIKRGVEVMIPRCVKEVLDNSERMKRERDERLIKLRTEEDGYHKLGSM
jgi:hypothetical protein